MILRTNEPDCFTLEITFENETAKQTNENSQGKSCSIDLRDEFNNNDDLWIESFFITIKLDYAGDQLGPGGRPQSPLTVEDNSNDYHFELSVVCCEKYE